MPIYLYEPTIYHEEEQVQPCCYFETLQSINEKPLSHCPTCQHPIHRAVAPFYAQQAFANKPLPQNFELKNTNSSMAKNIANLTSRHICSGGCKHE